MDCAGPGPKASKMLYEPLHELASDRDPHATDDALVTSTIINHEHGLQEEDHPHHVNLRRRRPH